jgi:hypothetical protein
MPERLVIKAELCCSWSIAEVMVVVSVVVVGVYAVRLGLRRTWNVVVDFNASFLIGLPCFPRGSVLLD